MVRVSDREYICKYLDESKREDGLRLLEDGIAPQYIVGDVDFYGNRFKVNPSVLIPRFETELLVEKSISYIRKIFDKDGKLDILDIGTGSGCIAIALASELDIRAVGVDISEEALVVARENATDNGVDVSFIRSDIFDSVSGKYDVIISNPPYIREDEEIEKIVYDNEPHLALFAKEEGLYFYRRILEGASDFLKDRFLIAFEIGESQGNAVKEIALEYLEDVSVNVEKDYSGRDRFVFVYRDC